VPGSDPKEYAIAHSALIYLIGPEGGIVTQFSNANDPDDMARTLTSLIK
jgi:cytochrome oxidase Cu insertion factor (SCO1/SenC/PrrC family)